MNPFRTFGLVGRLTVGLVALVIIAAGLWWAGGGARRDAAVAKAAAAMAASRAASGAEATETVATGAQRDAAGDKLTTENSNAIDHAQGAGQAVDPAANRAGAISLCKRRAYRNDPECVQLLGPVEPSGASPRR